MYKYSFIDWFTGKIDTDKLQELADTNKLDPKAYLFIRKFQSSMFIAFVGSLFEFKKLCFYLQCSHSLAEDELIENEIEIVSRQIDLFKQTYPDVYRGVIMGLDNRYSLSSEQIFKLGTEPLKIDFNGTAYDLSINLKYRRWLEWFRNDRYNFNSEPAFRLPYPIKEFWEQFHNYIPSREESEGGKEFYATIRNILISEYIDFTTNKLNESLKASYKTALSEASQDKKNKTTIEKESFTYKWLSNPIKELPELYQLLKANQLVHPDTTEEQLKAVFTAQPLQRIQPIRWHDDNASELLYFVLQLESSESIEAGKQTNYQRLTKCFVKSDGKPFDSAFKSLKQRIEIDLSEQKQQTIRAIINSFL